MSDHRVRMLMVLAALFWSGAFITGKLAVTEFPPFALTFFRFLLAVPFIFLLLYTRERDQWIPEKNQWLPLVILAFTGTFAYHAFFFSALQYTTAINSSLIGSTNPMVTTLLAALFFQERLTWSRIAGIIFSFSGVFIVITNADWNIIRTFHLNSGDLLMFIAVFCWAVYSLLGRRYMKEYSLSPVMVTAYTFLLCVIFSLPFVCWENPASYLPYTTMKGWLSIFYMSFFASVLGYLIQMVAIRKIGASRSAMFINLVPIFTIIQSITILGEAFSLYKLLGAGIIILGVYLAIRPEEEYSKVKAA